MQIFGLGDTRQFGAAAAAALGRGLDPHEERDFEDGEHNARPMVSVRGRDVYVLHALDGGKLGGASPNDRLAKLISTRGTMRRAAAARLERGAKAVFTLARHGLFGPGAEAMLDDAAIDRILVTENVPSAGRAIAGSSGQGVGIVPFAPPVAEAIRRLHWGGSIAELLDTRLARVLLPDDIALATD